MALGRDQGLIDDEQYELVICKPGPYFDTEAMKEDFGDSGDVLAQMVLSLPFDKMNGKDSFRFVLDGKECVLEKGKHYKYLF